MMNLISQSGHGRFAAPGRFWRNEMREFTIGKNDAGQRLDRFAGQDDLPLLPACPGTKVYPSQADQGQRQGR